MTLTGGGTESRLALGAQPLLAFIIVSIINYGSAGLGHSILLSSLKPVPLHPVAQVSVSWAAGPNIKTWESSGEQAQEALARG